MVTAESVSEVSCSPLFLFLRCHALRGVSFLFRKIFIKFANAKFHVWRDFAVKMSAMSYSPLNLFLRCHAHCRVSFCSVMQFAESVSAVSLSLLNLFLQCHEHRRVSFCSVMQFAESVSAVSCYIEENRFCHIMLSA